MISQEEKMEQIELNMANIEAVNNVLTDAAWYCEISNSTDYAILLEVQKEYIRKITNLF